jgi:hypothetical protein
MQPPFPLLTTLFSPDYTTNETSLPLLTYLPELCVRPVVPFMPDLRLSGEIEKQERMHPNRFFADSGKVLPLLSRNAVFQVFYLISFIIPKY